MRKSEYAIPGRKKRSKTVVVSYSTCFNIYLYDYTANEHIWDYSIVAINVIGTAYNHLCETFYASWNK